MITLSPSRRLRHGEGLGRLRQWETMRHKRAHINQTRLDEPNGSAAYVCFIRRESLIVSPFRRATEAVNDVRSSSGIPTSTTRPPGLAAEIASSTAWFDACALEGHVHFNAGRPFCAPELPCGVAPMCQRLRVEDGGCARAAGELQDEKSDGPAAEDCHRAPTPSLPRSTACSATPSGSSMAPSASVRDVGQRRPGVDRAMPSFRATRHPGARVRQNADPGRDWDIPARQYSHDPQEIDGSMATRCPSSVTPAASCPSTSGLCRDVSPIPACAEPVQIRTAQSDGLDAHERLVARGNGSGLILHANLTHRLQPCNLHGISRISGRSIV